MKFIDRTFGKVLLCLIRGKSRCVRKQEIRAVLIIRPGGIGDAVLLVPAINALKGAYPDWEIDILAEKRNAAVFHLALNIRSIYLYDSPYKLLPVFRNRYDVVIDTEQWYRLSAVVAHLVRAPMKIGFSTNQRASLFTNPVAYSQDDYEAEQFLALLHPLGITSYAALHPPFLHIPETAMNTASLLLSEVGGDPFIALFPGASLREKRWGKDRLLLLAARLASQRKVVIIGGREDVSVGDNLAGCGGLNLAGRTSLVETAAVISRAEVLVSGDSGVLHLAAGLGVPTVALFGPSSVSKWAPRSGSDKVVSARLDCSPCSFYGTIPPCPRDVGCMDAITVDEVVSAIESVIDTRSGRSKK